MVSEATRLKLVLGGVGLPKSVRAKAEERLVKLEPKVKVPSPQPKAAVTPVKRPRRAIPAIQKIRQAQEKKSGTYDVDQP